MATTKRELTELEREDVLRALAFYADDSRKEARKLDTATPESAKQYAAAIKAYRDHAERCDALARLLDDAESVMVVRS
jgi:hypothetical protein